MKLFTYLFISTALLNISLLANQNLGLYLPQKSNTKLTSFYKDGIPFKAMGINYFDAFQRKLGGEGKKVKLKDYSYVEGFKTLNKYKIPFIRFCAGGFFPNEWDSYINNKTAYFKAFDQFIKDAEEHNIGLIPTLFWHFPTVPDIVKEPINQWGNPDSKTIAFMKQYTQELISRYKDSPAILAWEFGNEWIHEADLPQADLGRGWIVPHLGTAKTRTMKDKMYRKNIYVAYETFAEIAKKIDPTRPVFSGDSIPRPAAYHNRSEASWKIDSIEEWSKIFTLDNSKMSALSAHLYYYDVNEVERDVGYIKYDPAEQLALMMDISRKVGKPLWIGEFGQNGTPKSLQEEKRQFDYLLNLIIKEDVPLSALWNFDYKHEDQTAWNISEQNHRAYMLKAIQQANKRLNHE
ncbi:cellulase family glycosylhydrolase [Lentisphaera profundi]|uniref:Cellulase family glycosylhydrolase n=1 Tax=Lentisphaera profundi TaxID=1658616 RepID=A0ABY7VU00_9BACT|nr:cellulase family glycosylhydrolase [Lentisphaera profundi]WDE97686.1 cellulase family glycosylhydrolase [Lentisphaera profundi]